MAERGGARQGAGRPKGSKDKATIEKEAARAEIIKKALDGGISPLEVMVNVMREHYASARYSEAASVAKDAAPYMHPKLASIDHKHAGEGGGPIQTKHTIEFVTRGQHSAS